MPMNPRTLRPYRKAAPPPSGTPASLLLRFDGNLDDSSSNSLTATAYGTAAASTDESKFGGSSLALDGASYLTVTDADAFAFGTGDFTAECWVRVDREAAINQYLFDFGSNVGQVQILNAFGYDGILAIDHAATTAYGYGPLSDNTWAHIAVSRKAGVVRFFIDGVMYGSMTDNGAYAGSTLTIGNYGGGGYTLYGYVDDLRIVKGLAVYDGDFVPPAAALPVNASPYANYKPSGTFLFSECVSGDLVGTYADGNGGRYTETISTGSC